MSWRDRIIAWMNDEAPSRAGRSERVVSPMPPVVAAPKLAVVEPSTSPTAPTKPSRQQRRWQPSEDNTIVAMVAAGCSLEEAGEYVGRTAYAVQCRFNSLGLRPITIRKIASQFRSGGRVKEVVD